MKHPNPTPRKKGAAREEGVALILALLFIVLLTVLVVNFGYETQVDASLSTNDASDLEAYLAAKSATAQGMAMLWDHLTGLQSGLGAVPGGLPGIPGGSGGGPAPGAQTPFSGEQYDSKFDPWAVGIPFEPINDATMRLTISDEYGKINLNALLIPGESGAEPQERAPLVAALRTFFTQRLAGESSAESYDPTDAILDWLDYGDSDNEREDGAEDDYYMGLENPFRCKNGPMDSLEELLLIKGITPKLYFGDPENEQLPLSEYLTVNGHWTGAINLNTAPRDVVFAIGQGWEENSGMQMNTSNMESLLMRLDAGEVIYSSADVQNIFTTNPGDPQQQNPNPDPNQNPNPNPNPQQGPQASPFVIASNCFRIYGDGMQGDVKVRIEAIVWRNSPLQNPNDIQAQLPQALRDKWNPPTENFRILSWKVIR